MTASDLTVIVNFVPDGPVPKNSGFVVVITSPAFVLSRVTVLEEVLPFGTENLEDEVDSEGSPTEAPGDVPSEFGGRFLKSYTCPRAMGGVGFADWG